MLSNSNRMLRVVLSTAFLVIFANSPVHAVETIIRAIVDVERCGSGGNNWCGRMQYPEYEGVPIPRASLGGPETDPGKQEADRRLNEWREAHSFVVYTTQEVYQKSEVYNKGEIDALDRRHDEALTVLRDKVREQVIGGLRDLKATLFTPEIEGQVIEKVAGRLQATLAGHVEQIVDDRLRAFAAQVEQMQSELRAELDRRAPPQASPPH